jgi:small subunit ribosomal protein S11
MAKVVAQKRRSKKNIPSAVTRIVSTFNNTTISVSDPQGNLICWSSAGLVGFSGSKQSTPYAAQMAAEDVAKKAQAHGVENMEVLVKGPGNGKESAIRALHSFGFKIGLIRDVTPIPHNGCRQPKRRRV